MNNLQAIAIGILLGGIAMNIGIIYARHEKQNDINRISLQEKRKFSKKIEDLKRKKEIQNLQKQIEDLRKDLKAYRYKIDDLSQAFIRHHGNYPRTIIKENE